MDPSRPDRSDSHPFTDIIVIAGASCAGKSTLTERLLNGDMQDLATAIGLDSNLTYYCLYGRDWHNVSDATSDRLLVQYDLTDSNPFADQGSLWVKTVDVLTRAKTVSFLTVWEAPDELRRRLEARFQVRGGIAYTVAQMLRKRGPRRAWHSLQRFRQRRRLFNAPRDLWVLYQRWFQSCAKVESAPHWILRSTAPDNPTRLVGPSPDTALWEKAP